eukprot:6620307-Alexandrium_andersonii.AAC.1
MGATAQVAAESCRKRKKAAASGFCRFHAWDAQSNESAQITHTRTHTHARTHARTHTHAHAQIQWTQGHRRSGRWTAAEPQGSS